MRRGERGVKEAHTVPAMIVRIEIVRYQRVVGECFYVRVYCAVIQRYFSWKFRRFRVKNYYMDIQSLIVICSRMCY